MLDREMADRESAIVHCKYCLHRPRVVGTTYYTGFDLCFPDNRCPCRCEIDGFYSWMPDDDWFCANGERNVSGDA